MATPSVPTTGLTTAATANAAAAAVAAGATSVPSVPTTTAAPTTSTPTQIEYKSMTDAGIPAILATGLQSLRGMVGLDPITDPAWLLVSGLFFVIFIGLLMSYTSQFITWIINTEIGGFLGQAKTKWQLIVFSLTIGYIISYFLYVNYLGPILRKGLGDVGGVIKAKIKLLESFSNQTPDTSLLNLQMLAVKQAAYIGPNEKDGTFDPSTAIQSALTSGVRVFVLQIGYLEVQKDSKKFDEPYMPTLLYRNDSGELISANGANIGVVAKALADAAFAPSLLSGSQPLIVYLHFERAPNSLRAPEKYVKYLSSVAQLLEPLQEYMIGVMPDGNFKRQKGESMLLNAPISTFEKKVIIMSNADTSIFRSLKTLGLDSINQKYDLDYMVNMRVYLDNSSDSFGITTAPINGTTPHAVIVPFKRLEGLSESEQDLFAIKGKTRFTISMPSQNGNPSLEALTRVVKNCGVNCVPLNLFGESVDSLKSKFKVWGNEPFYSVKSANYRALSQ